VSGALARLLGASATVAVEALATTAAMALFAIFLLVVGADPIAVYRDMFVGAFGSAFSLQNALARAAPLMLTALCTALPARLGMIIIGNEGALLLGGLASAATAMALPHNLPPALMLPAMLVAGALAGGLWISLAGLLRQRRGVNETISSMPGMDVHWGLCFGLCACLFSYALMEHTTFGFSARVVGGNMRAARGAGLGIGGLVLAACMLGGSAAGLAGAIEVTAVHGSANATLYSGLGFSGILVAFVARHHPLAIVPVAIAMGGIAASGGVLQRRHGLPDAAVDVFKGTLFLVILASETYVGRVQAFAEQKLAAVSESVRPARMGSVRIATATEPAPPASL
jgi:ABC-type uncharacterized transport system permease subunit